MSQTDFTIADVLAFARSKPAGERYNFYRAGTCAIAQFGEATGRRHLVDVPGIDKHPGISPELLNALIDGRWTFGALVTRLEKLCPDAPVPPSEWTRLDAYMTDIELASA